MIIPDEYRTGNKGMDEKIAAALRKENKVMPNPVTQFQLQQVNQKIRTNKYGVAEKEERTFRDGTLFASKREMERWDYLLKIQTAGEIKDLESQVPFVLQESFISRQHGDISELIYVADFVYTNISFRRDYPGRKIVEDSKGGMLTQVYKLKKKLFLYKYGEHLFFEV